MRTAVLDSPEILWESLIEKVEKASHPVMAMPSNVKENVCMVELQVLRSFVDFYLFMPLGSSVLSHGGSYDHRKVSVLRVLCGSTIVMIFVMMYV
jgi:hypothetical protein